MLHEFFQNFIHNLFKPLLLFFYFGFLIPILKVRFEFPSAIYQGLTMYLLVAIGWHGGEELAKIKPSEIGSIIGFMIVGFILNLAIGMIAYLLLRRTTLMRRIDIATVAGYYGSDSAGTFATCVGVLSALSMAFDAYMPVMLAIMEIPGCLVALFLVGRLRRRGMDVAGFMPDEVGYAVPAPDGKGPGSAARPGFREISGKEYAGAVGQQLEVTRDEREHPDRRTSPIHGSAKRRGSGSNELLREVFFNPGITLLFGGIVIGFISGLQGAKVVHDDDAVFVSAFQGALCWFLLEMGITASRKLKDLRSAGRGFVVFALVMPNIFAMLGISVAHAYAHLVHSEFKPGTYVLFAVLCAAASYIAVPAVQRLGIPEASPTLPLAASLGLTFSYNVTLGIPVYIEIARFFA